MTKLFAVFYLSMQLFYFCTRLWRVIGAEFWFVFRMYLDIQMNRVYRAQIIFIAVTVNVRWQLSVYFLSVGKKNEMLLTVRIHATCGYKVYTEKAQICTISANAHRCLQTASNNCYKLQTRSYFHVFRYEFQREKILIVLHLSLTFKQFRFVVFFFFSTISWPRFMYCN